MSTSRNNNDARPHQATPVGERPSTHASQKDHAAEAVRATPGVPAAFIAGQPAAGDVPAREDKDPVSFQRNAVAVRLNEATRQELAAKLG